MSETAAMVDKALYLRKQGVSFEGIAYVLGRSEMHWYRLCQSLGQASLVGTTLKTEAALPPIESPMRSTGIGGNRSYLAVTAAQGSVLGASLSVSADQDGLSEAYGVFQQEVAHHTPETVTTDGWDATRAAWKRLLEWVDTRTLPKAIDGRLRPLERQVSVLPTGF